MLHGPWQEPSRFHVPKPLVVRAGLGHTFGSLIAFLAFTLLAFGGYLLEDAFAHPLAAYAAALITAAFAIALALLLLFYLFKPRGSAGIRGCQLHSHARRAVAFPRRSTFDGRAANAPPPLAYQRIYVDPSRIRPRLSENWKRAESRENTALRGPSGDGFDALR